MICKLGMVAELKCWETIKLNIREFNVCGEHLLCIATFPTDATEV